VQSFTIPYSKRLMFSVCAVVVVVEQSVVLNSSRAPHRATHDPFSARHPRESSRCLCAVVPKLWPGYQNFRSVPQSLNENGLLLLLFHITREFTIRTLLIFIISCNCHITGYVCSKGNVDPVYIMTTS